MNRSLGTDVDNPIKIVILLNSRAVGDAIFFHIFSASVKNLFNHADLTYFQRNDRDYKIYLMSMNANVVTQLCFDDDDTTISIDSFQRIGDIASMGDALPKYVFNKKEWFDSNSNKANLVLSPTGMPEIMLTSFDQPAYLRIPEAQVESLSQELVSSGLDPKRWFCVLNYREPGYRFRPPRDLRNLNLAPFIELTQDIIKKLGGQVVRVGHPNMSAFPKRDGFVGLAPLEDNFALHAFAISRARFLVGSLTGISHLGSVVDTPTLITNCSDSTFMPGCRHAHDLALYINLYDSNGHRIPAEEQHDRDLHRRKKLLNLIDQDGFVIYQNNAREMAVAVRRMMDTTASCQGWRLPHIHLVLGDRPNRFEFPMALRRRVPIVEYPDLAAGP